MSVFTQKWRRDFWRKPVPDPEQLLRDWEHMPDNVREALLPKLMVRMRGWRAWSCDPRGRQMWLEHIFERAKIPFFGTFEPEKSEPADKVLLTESELSQILKL